jgi:hypothetical protein
MRILKRSLPLIMLIVILAACQDTGAAIPTPTVPPNWQNFQSSEGGFSVEFPTAPESQVWTGRDDDFGQVYRGVFTSTYQNMTYRVYYTVVSGGLGQFGTPDQILEMVRDGAVKDYKAKVLSSKPGSLGNYAGLEYSLDAPDSKALPGGGVIQSRVYLINDRIYAVEHLGPKRNSLLPDIKKFLDSFQVSGVAKLPTPLPAAASDVTAPEGWQDFIAQKDGFSVLLPDNPKREVISNDKTMEVVSYLAQAGLDGYSVLSFNLKDPALAKARPEVLLDVVKESILTGQQAVVLSETPIQLGPYAGYELLIKQPKSKEQPAEGQILMRLYLANTHLYAVMAITLGKDTPPEVAPFLDSFKVIDSK